MTTEEQVILLQMATNLAIPENDASTLVYLVIYVPIPGVPPLDHMRMLCVLYVDNDPTLIATLDRIKLYRGLRNALTYMLLIVVALSGWIAMHFWKWR